MNNKLLDYGGMANALLAQQGGGLLHPIADSVRGPTGPRGINAIAAPEAGGARGYGGGATRQHVLTGRPVGNAEKISGAAVKHDNKIYRGITHTDALMDMFAKRGLNHRDFDLHMSAPGVAHGFVTSSGRFLSRAEAKALLDSQR